MSICITWKHWMAAGLCVLAAGVGTLFAEDPALPLKPPDAPDATDGAIKGLRPDQPVPDAANGKAKVDADAKAAADAEAGAEGAAVEGDAKADVQVQLRGPVHEAFAEMYHLEPKPGPLVKNDPPADINEIPAAFRPEGNVVWAPGYWAWDEGRNDFLWVSGAWRVAPPGHRWVPGYWQKDSDGNRWISGFWIADDASQVQYQPPPPATQENGPNSAPPGDDYFWAPGCWVYQQGNYMWRPGSWAPYQANWVWMPSRYVWTPRGVIFINGHWDRRWNARGQLFAPVWIDVALRGRAGFTYTPSFAINAGQLPLHLFVRNNAAHHYYFGNYYGDNFVQAGFNPWYLTDLAVNGFDPNFAHARWYHSSRNGRDYVRDLTGWHNFFDKNDAIRPAVTVADQLALRSNLRAQPNVAQAILGDSLDVIARGSGSGRAWARISPQQQASLKAEVEQTVGLRGSRLKLEGNARADAKVEGGLDATKPVGEALKLPRRNPIRGLNDGPVGDVPQTLDRLIRQPRVPGVGPNGPRVPGVNPNVPKVDPKLPKAPNVPVPNVPVPNVPLPKAPIPEVPLPGLPGLP